MQINNKYLLVLPSWYPSDVDQYNGDFHRRFVEATALRQKQIVLYVIGNKDSKKTYHNISEELNIITYLVYYPKKHSFLGRIINVLRRCVLYIKFLSEIFSFYGHPALVQVYVFWPAGLIAYYLKKRFSLKYVIIENWTAFYIENPNNLRSKTFVSRFLFKKIMLAAELLIAVAERLKSKMLEWVPNSQIEILPNVVNASIFSHSTERVDKPAPFRFVHVSTMGYQKNCEGLLDAFENLSRLNHHSQLILIGPVREQIQLRIKNSDFLKANTFILGELDQTGVALQMSKANCLVLFSRYENLPCVVLEALCSGLPVIATDVGGCKEVIDRSNGLIISSEDVAMLETALLRIESNYNLYNSKAISKTALALYSYEKVAVQLENLHSELTD